MAFLLHLGENVKVVEEKQKSTGTTIMHLDVKDRKRSGSLSFTEFWLPCPQNKCLHQVGVSSP